jgi:probable F420-dependent oxidoreductase
MAAARTERVEICTGVLIAPMRQPLVLAKQIASIDQASGGRVVLGVGAGWLAEEFEALEVPFDGRGARLEAIIEILRGSWSGRTAAHDGVFDVPADAYMLPTPTRIPPILFGGGSRRALARAGRLGHGYVGVIDATLGGDSSLPWQTDDVGLQKMKAQLDQLVGAAEQCGRKNQIQRIVMHVFGSDEDVARAIPLLAANGVNEIVIQSPSWRDLGPTLATLNDTIASVN